VLTAVVESGANNSGGRGAERWQNSKQWQRDNGGGGKSKREITLSARQK